MLAAAVSWRLAFLLPALSAAVLVVVLRRLPEPPRGEGPAGGLRVVLRHRWGLVVLGLALVEGGALLGLLTYFAPALESTGASPTVAGAVVALYGVGLLVSSRVVKRLAGRVRPAAFLASGAAGLAVAYTAVALDQQVWTIGPAALAVGAAWAAMHSTMQHWATEVVPGARAVTVSLFAGMLFVGSGVATAGLAPWAGEFRWAPLYLVGAGVAVVFGVAAVWARTAYGRPHQLCRASCTATVRATAAMPTRRGPAGMRLASSAPSGPPNTLPTASSPTAPHCTGATTAYSTPAVALAASASTFFTAFSCRSGCGATTPSTPTSITPWAAPK